MTERSAVVRPWSDPHWLTVAADELRRAEARRPDLRSFGDDPATIVRRAATVAPAADDDEKAGAIGAEAARSHWCFVTETTNERRDRALQEIERHTDAGTLSSSSGRWLHGRLRSLLREVDLGRVDATEADARLDALYDLARFRAEAARNARALADGGRITDDERQMVVRRLRGAVEPPAADPEAWVGELVDSERRGPDPDGPEFARLAQRIAILNALEDAGRVDPVTAERAADRLQDEAFRDWRRSEPGIVDDEHAVNGAIRFARLDLDAGGSITLGEPPRWEGSGPDDEVEARFDWYRLLGTLEADVDAAFVRCAELASQLPALHHNTRIRGANVLQGALEIVADRAVDVAKALAGDHVAGDRVAAFGALLLDLSEGDAARIRLHRLLERAYAGWQLPGQVPPRPFSRHDNAAYRAVYRLRTGNDAESADFPDGGVHALLRSLFAATIDEMPELRP